MGLACRGAAIRSSGRCPRRVPARSVALAGWRATAHRLGRRRWRLLLPIQPASIPNVTKLPRAAALFDLIPNRRPIKPRKFCRHASIQARRLDTRLRNSWPNSTNSARGRWSLLHLGPELRPNAGPRNIGRNCWAGSGFWNAANYAWCSSGGAGRCTALRQITGGLPWPNLADWTGRLSIAELAAVAERAAVFVGADTGRRGLAAAVRAPVVRAVQWHETTPGVWKPVGSDVTVLPQPVPGVPDVLPGSAHWPIILACKGCSRNTSYRQFSTCWSRSSTDFDSQPVGDYPAIGAITMIGMAGPISSPFSGRRFSHIRSSSPANIAPVANSARWLAAPGQRRLSGSTRWPGNVNSWDSSASQPVRRKNLPRSRW